MKKYSFVLFAALWCFQLIGQTVKPNEAIRVARNGLYDRYRTVANPDMFAVNDIQVKIESGDTMYYIVNLQPDGFVVVSGDRRLSPVLAHSAAGRLATEDVNPEFQYWLDWCAEQVKIARTQKLKPGVEQRAEWEKLLSEKYPTAAPDAYTVGTVLLGNLTWSQNPRYNNSCPVVTGGCNPDSRAPTGCGATAIAQIMKYYGYPATGEGSKSYSWNGQTLSANFGNTTYQWSQMPVELTANSTSAQISAVATLMYHCGVGVSMNYGSCTAGSWSNMTDANAAFQNYFRYSKSSQVVNRSSYVDSNWVNLLKTEINAERPILYRAADSNGANGHIWVCDGYKANNEFHMNWGWGSGGGNAFVNISPLYVPIGYSSTNNTHWILKGVEPRTAAPANVQATDGAYSNRVVVSWSNGGSGWTSANVYRVYRYTSNNPNAASAISGWISGTSFDDTGVSAGTTYYYWVEGAKSSNTNVSPKSSYNTGYAASSCTVPATLWTTGITTNSAVFNWSAASGAQSYSVQWRFPGGAWTDLSGGPWALTALSVTGFASNTTYEWRVRTNCSSGQTSNWSAGIGFTTTGFSLANDNCANATLLSVGSSCSYTYSTNIGATPSTPAPIGSCPSGGYQDVWFKFTMPNVSTPQVTIRTTAGSLTDAVMEVYYGSTCSNMVFITCEDDNTNGNGSYMPVINLQGGPNNTIWVRVWGYGGSTGTFSICVLNYYSSNIVGNDDNEGKTIAMSVSGDQIEITERESSDNPSLKAREEPSLLFHLAPNPADDFLDVSFSPSEHCRATCLVLSDLSGKVIIKQPIEERDENDISERLNVADLTPGVYLLRLMTTKGSVAEKVIITHH